MRIHTYLTTDVILIFLSLFRKIFPGSATARGPVLTDTPLARIRAMLDAEEQAATDNTSADQGVTAGGEGGEKRAADDGEGGEPPS